MKLQTIAEKTTTARDKTVICTRLEIKRKQIEMIHKTRGKRYSTETAICLFKTRAAMKTMYSYLHPYLQRMEQPVRKRRNQKFSVSELDLKVHKENR